MQPTSDTAEEKPSVVVADYHSSREEATLHQTQQKKKTQKEQEEELNRLQGDQHQGKRRDEMISTPCLGTMALCSSQTVLLPGEGKKGEEKERRSLVTTPTAHKHQERSGETPPTPSVAMMALSHRERRFLARRNSDVDDDDGTSIETDSHLSSVQVPGARAVPGIRGSSNNDDEFTISAPTDATAGGVEGNSSTRSNNANAEFAVQAELVDTHEEDRRLEERLEEELQARLNLEREERDRNMFIAEVVGTSDEEGQKQNQAAPAGWLCYNMGRRQLLCFAILVGVSSVAASVLAIVFARDPSDTTMPPTLRPTMLGVLGGPDTSSPTTSQNPSSAPSSLPSSPPSAPPITGLVELLVNVSSDRGEALLTLSSPQNSALNWLAGNTNIQLYSDEKKIHRYALATFFYSTNGNGWHNNAGWLSDSDECAWYNQADDGPYCAGNGGVRELDWFTNNIRGTIPPEVGLLSNSLVEFGAVNAFSGTVPTEIGLLTGLRALWLQNNDLTGTIPTELYLMTSLRTAWLQGNAFNGSFVCPNFLIQCFI